MFESGGQELAQPLCQFLRWFVAEARKDNLLELACLLGNGIRNGRVCMPVQGHPPGRDGIKDLPAVASIKLSAFRAIDEDRFQVK